MTVRTKDALKALLTAGQPLPAAVLHDLIDSLPVVVDARAYATLQDALDAVPAGGAIVRLDLDTYTISDTLAVKNNTEIAGVGPGSIITCINDFGDKPLFRNANALTIADPADRDHDIYIHDLAIDGNKANNSTATEISHGIEFRAVYSCRVERCYIHDCKGDGVSVTAYPGGLGAGEYADRTPDDIWVMNNKIKDVARTGIALIEGRGLHATGNRISGAAAGLVAEDDNANSILQEVVVSGNHISDTTTVGITVSSGAGIGVIKNVVVEGNIITGAWAGRGIGYRGCQNVIIADNTIYGTDATAGAEGIGKEDAGADPINVLIDGNVIYDVPSYGIRTVGTVSIEKNKIYNPGNAGLFVTGNDDGIIALNRVEGAGALAGMYMVTTDYASINGNVFVDNVGDGIRMEPATEGCTRCTFVGNVCTGNSDYGIDEGASAGCDYNVYTGNILAGNTTGTIRTQGANDIIGAQ